MPILPWKFSPIFTNFSNDQLLLKHTPDCCTENAKPRGKCENCHSATTHHLSAMKITDCMLINSLQTHFSITIYTSSLQKSIASDTPSISFNSCNQSLPNTEIKSHWTLIPFLLNPLPNYYLKLTTHPISIQSHPITPFNLWLLKTVMKTTLNHFKSL